MNMIKIRKVVKPVETRSTKNIFLDTSIITFITTF